MVFFSFVFAAHSASIVLSLIIQTLLTEDMVASLNDYGLHSQAIADTTVEEGLKDTADITRNLENFRRPSLIPFKRLLC